MLKPCNDYPCWGGMVVLHSKVVVAVAKQVSTFSLWRRLVEDDKGGPRFKSIVSQNKVTLYVWHFSWKWTNWRKDWKSRSKGGLKTTWRNRCVCLCVDCARSPSWGGVRARVTVVCSPFSRSGTGHRQEFCRVLVITSVVWIVLNTTQLWMWFNEEAFVSLLFSFLSGRYVDGQRTGAKRRCEGRSR